MEVSGGSRAFVTSAPLVKIGDSSKPTWHFDKVAFGDEMMVPDKPLDARFSVMSLAVAADSGWFQVDFDTADSYNWAKNQGCSVLGSDCPRSVISEFCNTVSTTTCSDDFEYINMCVKNKYAGPCKLNKKHRSCKVYRKSHVRAFQYGQFSICQNCVVATCE